VGGVQQGLGLCCCGILGFRKEKDAQKNGVMHTWGEGGAT